jgi:hypothetical protein
MVWIKWEDYGKKPKPRKQKKKKSKPRVESASKIIPGKHKAEFRKASDIMRD